jgi:hypothetical protein
MNDKFHGILALPSMSPGSGLKARRAAVITEAINWPKGSIENKLYREIYSYKDYKVKLGIPGKEAAPGYPKLNEDDMTPTVFHKAKKMDFTPTFLEIFRDFQNAALSSSSHLDATAMEYLAALLFRSAYMLDHEATESGSYRWMPNSTVVEELSKLMNGRLGVSLTHPDGSSSALPLIVYLQLVEALAINEDVKYQANSDEFKVKGLPKNDAGRKNTLLTCVHVIGVILGRIPVHELMGSASNGRGVAPLGISRAVQAFPILFPK